MQTDINHPLLYTSSVQYYSIETRAVPNIRFVFALGANSGLHSYSIFGRTVAVKANTNGGH